MKFSPKEEKLLRKILSKYEDEFTASNLTHDKACGFEYVKDIVPALDKLVDAGKLFKGERHNHYHVTNPITSRVNKKEDEEENIYTEEYKATLEQKIKKYRIFIIMTAVMCKGINKDFVNAIRNFCKRNNALPIVLPCEDVKGRGKKAKPIELSPEIDDFSVIFKDTYINNNLCLSAIKCTATQMNPLRSMEKFTTDKQASVILASPKSHLKFVPCKKGNIPAAIMTPGAITLNNYNKEVYFNDRNATIAEVDHAYGAIIVEKQDDKLFYFTHVRASKDNSLTDKGIEYFPDGSIKKQKGGIFVMGDSHTGYHDYELFKSAVECAKSLGAKEVVLHDIFNATSISHHDNNKGITRAKKADRGLLSLEDELLAVKYYLEELNEIFPNITIVNSNHDNHLQRYLEESGFIKDFQNYNIGCKLASACIEGHNPLQYAIEEIFGLKRPCIKWLELDESYVKYGVELGMHGSEGANGGRGSNKTFEKCIGNCVTAHSHSAQLLKDAMVVGTTSYLQMDYNKGLSSWTRTCAIVYPNGTKQLINFIPDGNGSYKWKL